MNRLRGLILREIGIGGSMKGMMDLNAIGCEIYRGFWKFKKMLSLIDF